MLGGHRMFSAGLARIRARRSRNIRLVEGVLVHGVAGRSVPPEQGAGAGRREASGQAGA